MAEARQAADRGTRQRGVSPSRRQSGNGPRTIRYRDVTLGAAVLGGQVDVRMTGGPWWAAFLLTVLGLVLGLGAVLVRIVFPQDSADKLAWWRDRRRTRRQRGAAAERPERRAH